jgi:hypothetical protein
LIKIHSNEVEAIKWWDKGSGIKDEYPQKTIKWGNKEVKPLYSAPIQINPWNKVGLYSLNFSQLGLVIKWHFIPDEQEE